MEKKAMIAMSGGVDSSVAAYLAMQAGYICAGGTMRLCDKKLLGQEPADNVADAKTVAERLGIPFHELDCTEAFRQQVVDPFIAAYEQGLTPNPCITCNKHLKFDLFLQKALELGYPYVVTGHYARIKQDPATGRYLLCKAPDAAKDQSYFLAGLTQHQLAHTLFPLGELTKEQVRQIAEAQGFITARKRDSQDICFIPDGDYFAFMQRYTGKVYPAGDFLDRNGNVVGRHNGAVAYTLGQRKGLGIALGEPVYVCSKDMQHNTVTVGPNDALFSTSLLADRWNWISIPKLEAPLPVKAKARSRHAEQPATAYPMENGTVKVVFDEPQRAITPGQAVVLYDGDTVVGSGTITGVL